jgi:hypothetical protein
VTLRVKQDSVYQGNNWWKWSVWLEGRPKDLAVVDHVVYTLHPTFPDPVRIVRDRRTGFRLESSGWGEFELYLEIVDKNGKTHRRRHWLRLSYPAKGVEGKQGQLESTKGPVAYVSSSAADSSIARKVREALSDRGFQVRSMEELPADIPWKRVVDEILSSAEVAVFLLSGQPSLWTQTEIELALSRKVSHVVPVVIGDAEVPDRLKSFQSLRLDPPDDVERLADRILEGMDSKASG